MEHVVEVNEGVNPDVREYTRIVGRSTLECLQSLVDGQYSSMVLHPEQARELLSIIGSIKCREPGCVKYVQRGLDGNLMNYCFFHMDCQKRDNLGASK